MDKELFKELEANLIQALELVRSAQTNQNSPQEQVSDDKVLSRDADLNQEDEESEKLKDDEQAFWDYD